MLIGSKAQIKSLNVDDFILSYDETRLELVENAKYLGMFINCDISWDFHVWSLYRTAYYHISLLRRLRRIFPMNRILQVYKSYIQPRLDYGITLYGSSTQKNIDLVQRVQNHAARLIMGNFDHKNSHGIDLVKSLNLYAIRERRGHFLLTLMFKVIQRFAPSYLSDRIDKHFDIHVYDTKKLVQWTSILQLRTKRYAEIVLLYLGGKLRNDLPDFVKNSTNIENFKLNYIIYKGIT